MNLQHHLHTLPSGIPLYYGRQDYVVAYSSGKDVLHLGCVDEGFTRQRLLRGSLLHERVYRVARSLWGVDIDSNGIELMQSHGYPNLYCLDIEHLDTLPALQQQHFDLVLLTEVLEHVDNPGQFLNTVQLLFDLDTELLITVPNATGLANLLSLWSRKELVHPDHNYWFSYNTLISLLSKHGFEITSTAVYTTHPINRSILKHVKNKIDGNAKLQSRTDFQPAQERQAVALSGVKRRSNVGGFIRNAILTLFYRVLLSRNPFFAEGLIVTARPAQLKGR
jgi:2-polyprenyl-3-methyl-5-hydroxy-6-metoxy-1,4-benzoquinol methylase